MRSASLSMARQWQGDGGGCCNVETGEERKRRWWWWCRLGWVDGK
jgi:hypothetical protein